MTLPVISQIQGRVGRLTLNRPAALHALTQEMCQLMVDALQAWRRSPQVRTIMIDHAGERGFCAGGDIRMVAQSGAGDGAAAADFFRVEYQLNDLLFAYEKPIIAVMDGVTMGGGCGLALPARVRVATERTLLAMPEARIGLFPDVGGGWHLPRLPDEIGTWLALTGARLRAADCREAGLATHFIPSDRLDPFKQALMHEDGGLDELLDRFGADPGPSDLTQRRPQIRAAFSGSTVEQILQGLERDGSDWAQAQLREISINSPTTLKVALRQLHAGARMNAFAEVMRMEFRIASRITALHDFSVGVEAALNRRGEPPQWMPASLDQVSDVMLDALFQPLPDDREWRPLPTP